MAVMATGVDAPTATVLTVNVAVVAPAGTVMLAGTVAEVELLTSVNTVPPSGDGPFNVTVPVEVATPPSTIVGFITTDVTDRGTTVRGDDCPAAAARFDETETPVDVPAESGVVVNVLVEV